MKDDPIVSIIITCYNLGQYLPEAIGSAIKQTYKNIEIIVIDDGSTDDTPSIAQRYKSVKYIRQSNQGVCAARNKGIDLSEGELVIFLDADDRLDRSYIDQCITKLRSYKKSPQVGYVFTQVRHFGVEELTTNYPDFDIEILTKSGPYINVSALINKESISSVRFNTKITSGYEDWDFYLSLYEKGTEGRLLNKALLHYRRTGSDSSVSFNTEGTYKLFRAKYNVMRLHPNLFPKRHILIFCIRYWLSTFINTLKALIKGKRYE